MKVKELKCILEKANDDNDVVICVNTPAGYVCPDGAIVDVKEVHVRGIDWHSHETLIIPTNKLDVHDIEKWSHGVRE